MTKLRLFRAAGTVLLMLGGFADLASAQTAGAAQPVPADDLLTEVRELRAEIKQVAAASIRMQLLIARLQLQEQRTYTVARQIADVQELLAKVRQEIAQQSTHIKQMEEAESRTTDEGERHELRQMVPALKTQLEPNHRREQELRMQEGDLLTLLAAEQARWAEFNDRLDSLERSLPAGSAR